MATFKKLASGKWQAQVARKGLRKSASFNTKREAQDWAARQEYLALNAPDIKNSYTLGDAFNRYAREETIKKRGVKWENLRLEGFQRHAISQKLIVEITASDFALWRDERLKQISPSSVNREMTIMSAVMTVARREWGWILHNPLSDVRKPSAPPPRDRRISEAEIAKLIESSGGDLKTATGRSIQAFRFAIETAMRAGEIVGLTAETVDFDTRVATLPKTKNGTMRQVPLSSKAIELLKELPTTDGSLFALKSAQLDALFRRVRDRAKIENLTFHDSRHEAITRLSSKFDVLSLARIAGHKDIKMLMIYYNETAEELAKRLD
jgi:integrase